jgi:peptide/nickel transport system substrate-binding protein
LTVATVATATLGECRIMGLNRRGIKGALAATLAIVLAGPMSAHAQSVLRLVPQADLKILDTVQTTNNITSNHGYMIYDTLFSLDSKLMPKPQMVESYTKSADGLNWTFKLRPGLKFHDGQPVTSKDVVASILRFSKRIPAGVTVSTTRREPRPAIKEMSGCVIAAADP